MSRVTNLRVAAVAGALTVTSFWSAGNASASSLPAHDITATTVSRAAATPEQRDSVLRLYRAYFLRAPDASGHAYWANQYSSGRMTLAGISQFFSLSNEFKTRYGSLSNADFVELIYTNVLGRTPDRAGEGYWTQKLNRGTSRGSIMIGFSESPEFQRKTGTRPPAPAVSWSNQMLSLINAERGKHGLRALSLCGTINKAAQGHSADMAANRYFSHTARNGSDAGQRMNWAGYRWSMWGENIAMGGTTSVPEVVNGWMNSPSHRANILNGGYVHMGLGRAADSAGNTYWTQNFGTGGAC